MIWNRVTRRHFAVWFGMFGAIQSAVLSVYFFLWDFQVGVPGYAAVTETVSGVDVLAGDLSGITLSYFFLGLIGATISVVAAYSVSTRRYALLEYLLVAVGVVAAWQWYVGDLLGQLLSTVVLPIFLSVVLHVSKRSKPEQPDGRLSRTTVLIVALVAVVCSVSSTGIVALDAPRNQPSKTVESSPVTERLAVESVIGEVTGDHEKQISSLTFTVSPNGESTNIYGVEIKYVGDETEKTFESRTDDVNTSTEPVFALRSADSKIVSPQESATFTLNITAIRGAILRPGNSVKIVILTAEDAKTVFWLDVPESLSGKKAELL
ncbi:hypothetical protein [Halorussus ruber]|uniref:hypothetical protein n=1 Tax=Halorussus ruber TaxID=1126238 RepID=UPI001092EFFD|nr:hypothetical protein [Halorussus ruber]